MACMGAEVRAEFALWACPPLCGCGTRSQRSVWAGGPVGGTRGEAPGGGWAYWGSAADSGDADWTREAGGRWAWLACAAAERDDRSGTRAWKTRKARRPWALCGCSGDGSGPDARSGCACS